MTATDRAAPPTGAPAWLKISPMLVREARARGLLLQFNALFEGLAINDALSLINQMVLPYTMADVLTYMDERLSEQKLGRIVDTLFAGLSAQEGGARGLKGLRAA